MTKWAIAWLFWAPHGGLMDYMDYKKPLFSAKTIFSRALLCHFPPEEPGDQQIQKTHLPAGCALNANATN